MAESARLHYVYLHRRNSDGQPFYVGKGSGRRAWAANPRSRWWHSVNEKHGRIVEIIKDGLCEKAAHILEVDMIGRLRSSGAALCNMTDGGEGRSGHISPKRKVVFCSNGMKFASTMEAGRWLVSQGHKKASGKAITAACKGQKNVVYGHCWSFKEPPTPPNLNGKKARGMGAAKAFGIKVYASDGRSFETASEAATAVAGNAAMSSKILLACRGKRFTAFGLTWSLTPEGCPEYKSPIERSNLAKLKPIGCSNGMTFPSRKAAVEWGRGNGLALSQVTLSRCAENPALKSGGLHWWNIGEKTPCKI